MKARLFQLLLLMIVSFFASSLLAYRVAAQEAKGGLRGQVTDPSGSTVGGATILLTTPSGASLDTVTTKDGLYEFKNLAPLMAVAPLLHFRLSYHSVHSERIQWRANCQ